MGIQLFERNQAACDASVSMLSEAEKAAMIHIPSHLLVPVLWPSATAILYLDNQRDMADELFDGNIALELPRVSQLSGALLIRPNMHCLCFPIRRIWRNSWKPCAGPWTWQIA